VAIDQISTRMTNELAEIPRLAARVDAFCVERNIHGGVAHRFNLALEEALTNIVAYGFPDGGRHEIEIRVVFEDSSLMASISDDGVAFDPLSQAAPDIHAGVEEREVGGLGIHLLRKLTDAVYYRRRDGRNQLTFRMRTDATS
jgi:serine/threonine-protein kinase RsbW